MFKEMIKHFLFMQGHSNSLRAGILIERSQGLRSIQKEQLFKWPLKLCASA